MFGSESDCCFAALQKPGEIHARCICWVVLADFVEDRDGTSPDLIGASLQLSSGSSLLALVPLSLKVDVIVVIMRAATCSSISNRDSQNATPKGLLSCRRIS